MSTKETEGVKLARFRQQKSFGRDQVKQWWAVRLQGIAIFAEAVDMSAGATVAAQVLPDLQRSGPCGKEASLLT